MFFFYCQAGVWVVRGSRKVGVLFYSKFWAALRGFYRVGLGCWVDWVIFCPSPQYFGVFFIKIRLIFWFFSGFGVRLARFFLLPSRSLGSSGVKKGWGAVLFQILGSVEGLLSGWVGVLGRLGYFLPFSAVFWVVFYKNPPDFLGFFSGFGVRLACFFLLPSRSLGSSGAVNGAIIVFWRMAIK